MENFAFTLFNSVLAFWAVLAAFIIVLFICESTKSGYWAMVSFIAVAIGYYFYSNFDILSHISGLRIVIYFVTGLIFSLFRCFFYARRISNKIKKKDTSHEEEQKELKEAKNKIKEELQDNVFRWWFMWPASFLYWVFSNMLADAWDWMFTKLVSTYHGIVDAAFK